MTKQHIAAKAPVRSAELRLLLALIDAVIAGRDHIYNSALLAELDRLQGKQRVAEGSATWDDLMEACAEAGGLSPAYEYAGLSSQEQIVFELTVRQVSDREIARYLEEKRPKRLRQFGKDVVSVEAVYQSRARARAKLKSALDGMGIAV